MKFILLQPLNLLPSPFDPVGLGFFRQIEIVRKAPARSVSENLAGIVGVFRRLRSSEGIHSSGIGPIRTKAGADNPDHVFAISGEAVFQMKRSWVGEPGLIVILHRIIGGRLDREPVGKFHPARHCRQEYRGLGLQGRPKHGFTRHPLGSSQILLHERWRNGQGLRHVIEPVRRIVLREIARGLAVDTQQVAHRIVVFGPV